MGRDPNKSREASNNVSHRSDQTWVVYFQRYLYWFICVCLQCTVGT